MNTTLKIRWLPKNSFMHRLATVSQVVAGAVRDRPALITRERAESSGDEIQSRRARDRAELHAAAQCTFTVLHQ